MFQEQCEAFCDALKKELPSSAHFVQPKVSFVHSAGEGHHSMHYLLYVLQFSWGLYFMDFS